MALCRATRRHKTGKTVPPSHVTLMTDGTCLEFFSLEAPLDEVDLYHSTGARYTHTASPTSLVIYPWP
eukprot:m.146695 g.146695  ORF g.146695 m.146695 type:complete len:68 (+) comp23123_c2_seq2:2287-2490(+)